MLPDPGRRLITALFLGTALSISSVKIVAMVVRDMGFMRRLVGQVIIASAIIDDTIGWIIMAITFGLVARHGSLDVADRRPRASIGTALFLHRQLHHSVRARYFLLIRWANDNFVMEFPVITAILVLMGTMALITYAIGVNTVLGAFVAGMLVGPIAHSHETYSGAVARVDRRAVHADLFRSSPDCIPISRRWRACRCCCCRLA